LPSDRTRYERLEFQHDVNGFLPSDGDFRAGDIMTDSLVTIAAALVTIAAAVAGLVVVAVSARRPWDKLLVCAAQIALSESFRRYRGILYKRLSCQAATTIHAA
jgi:hypothetical protein